MLIKVGGWSQHHFARRVDDMRLVRIRWQYMCIIWRPAKTLILRKHAMILVCYWHSYLRTTRGNGWVSTGCKTIIITSSADAGWEKIGLSPCFNGREIQLASYRNIPHFPKQNSPNIREKFQKQQDQYNTEQKPKSPAQENVIGNWFRPTNMREHFTVTLKIVISIIQSEEVKYYN